MTLTIVTRGTRRKYGYVRRNCLVCGPLSSCRNVVTSAAKQLKAYPAAHDQRSSLQTPVRKVASSLSDVFSDGVSGKTCGFLLLAEDPYCQVTY